MDLIISLQELTGVERAQKEFELLMDSLDKDELSVEQQSRIVFVEKLLNEADDELHEVEMLIEKGLENITEKAFEYRDEALEAQAKVEILEEHCEKLEAKVANLEGQLKKIKTEEEETGKTEPASGNQA